MKFLVSLLLTIIALASYGAAIKQHSWTTNEVPGADPYVQNYVRRVGISATASNQVHHWAQTLREAGIFTNLVDVVFLRSNLNHGTLASIQAFTRSNTVTLQDSASMRYDKDGLYLPGSATMRAYWTQVPHTPTNTIVAQLRTWFNPVNSYVGNMPFMYWGGQISGSYSSIGLTMSGASMRLFACFSGGVCSDAGVLYDRAGAIAASGWLRTFFISQHPSVGSFVSADGVVCNDGQVPASFYSILASPVAGQTNIQVGYQSATHYVPRQIASWGLFNKVLSRAETEAALIAWRYLDGQDENHIAYGDSRIVHAGAGIDTLSWFGRLELQGRFANARFYDGARSGSTITNLLSDLFYTNILQWRPQGAVKKATVWLHSDYNDAADGAPTMWLNYSNVTLRLKQAGFHVKAVIPNINNSQSAVMKLFHPYIRTNASVFDEVIHLGQCVNEFEFSKTYWSPDTLHYSTNMARVVADWIGNNFRRVAPRLEPTVSYETVATGAHAWTNYFGYMRHALVGGGTVSWIKLGTNTLGLTSGVFPVNPNEVLTISNSVAPTLQFLDTSP